MRLYLTRIMLDTGHPAVRADLADMVALHRRIMSLVPDGLGQEARASSGVLFRVDEVRNGIQLLIQTGPPPMLERLPEGYGSIASRSLRPLLEALHEGMVVRYRIVANPSKRLGRSSDRPGAVVALRGEQADGWWATHAARHGLLLRHTTSHHLPDLRGTHHGGQRICHAAVRFDGTATIANPYAVSSAVLAGIGRGKPYGCGLLSLAPAGAATERVAAATNGGPPR